MTISERDKRWCAQHDSIERQISQLTAPLYAKLEALDDQRCDGCGKFLDDDNDTHSKDCRFAGRS